MLRSKSIFVPAALIGLAALLNSCSIKENMNDCSKQQVYVRCTRLRLLDGCIRGFGAMTFPRVMYQFKLSTTDKLPSNVVTIEDTWLATHEMEF